MKFKSLLMSGVLVSLSIASGAQVYAAMDGQENIKTDVVYEVREAAENGSNEEAMKAMYNEQCFEVLEKYFGITRDQLPKDAAFNVRILSKSFLDQEEAKYLKELQEELAQKKIDQAEYDKSSQQIKKQYDNCRSYLKKNNRDDVSCVLYGPKAKENINDRYMISINPNTKEVYFALIPVSDKGWEITKNVIGKPGEPCKPYSVPAATEKARKDFCVNYIKKVGLGNIQNPEFVKIHGATCSHYIYKEANDDSKYVEISFDPSQETRVVGFETDSQDVIKNFIEE